MMNIRESYRKTSQYWRLVGESMVLDSRIWMKSDNRILRFFGPGNYVAGMLNQKIIAPFFVAPVDAIVCKLSREGETKLDRWLDNQATINEQKQERLGCLSQKIDYFC